MDEIETQQTFEILDLFLHCVFAECMFREYKKVCKRQNLTLNHRNNDIVLNIAIHNVDYDDVYEGLLREIANSDSFSEYATCAYLARLRSSEWWRQDFKTKQRKMNLIRDVKCMIQFERCFPE